MAGTPIKAMMILVTAFMLHAVSLDAKEQIVYSHLTDGYWQIWIMDADGQNQRQVTSSAADKREPEWMSDMDRVICRTNNGQLVMVDPKSHQEEDILPGFGNVHGPRYSPVIKKLIFTSVTMNPAETSEIWLSDLDGKDVRLVTRDMEFKYHPGFSPTADRIIFVKSGEDRNVHNIWSIDLDGTDLKQLTFAKARDTYPDLSRDEKFMVFSSNREKDNYDLYLLEVNNDTVKKLFGSPGIETSPKFSGDGKEIIFVSSQSGSLQVWSIGRDGGGLRQLTAMPDESVDPAWADVTDDK